VDAVSTTQASKSSTYGCFFCLLANLLAILESHTQRRFCLTSRGGFSVAFL